MSTNNLTIDGRLAADPEIRFLGSGQAVANIRIGHTPREKRDGEWVNGETVWLTAEMWGKPAEEAVETLSKGDLVLVSGELRTRTYELNGGQRQSWEIKRATVGLVKRKAQQSGAGFAAAAGVAANDPWASVPVGEEPAPW